MRIGVVSDTHNHLTNVARIVELFNAARVDHVIHTGDITQARTLDVFAQLQMPLHGVFGNNDVERDTLDPAIARHGFVFVEPPLRVHWHGRSIVVVHDPRDFEQFELAPTDVALHGHTHMHRIERTGGGLIFNPGECAGHMAGFNAIGILNLESLEVELLRF